MRIFITGGTGFIGKHIVKKLKENNDLLLLVQKSEEIESGSNKNIIYGDLSNISDWKEKVINFKPEITIHLAWEGIPDYGPEMSIKNLNYGINLIKMLTETTCKHIISTGSCWEYGKDPNQLKENTHSIPSNAFSVTKNTLYLLGKEIAEKNDIKFTWTRLFYVYGPGQKETSLIPYLIKSIKENKKPEIKTSGTKNDFIFIEDIVDAISAIIKNPRAGVYNIGSGKSTSVREIIKIICDHYNFKFKPPKTETKVNFLADISKIKKEIDWEPKTNINEGIKKTINSYENHYKN